MKKGLTEIVLLVDNSGSMQPTEKDTLGGLNTFIKSQKALEGTAKLTLTLFNTYMDNKLFRVDINEVKPLQMEDYVCNGGTALFDAACKLIDQIGKELRNQAEADRPERILFAIMTDGEENSSISHTITDLAEKIKIQTEIYNWEFVFLGANFDAFGAGKNYNIKYTNTMSYSSSNDLATRGMDYLTQSVSNYRNTGDTQSESNSVPTN